MIKRTTIWALALILILTLGLVACEPAGDDNEATYTVTVTCTEASALEGVKVQLKQGDTLKSESALTDGKATFTLEKGDYTVTLTGVPSGYLFTDGSVSATKLDCTIELKAGYAYSVTVTYPERKDVYDNPVSAAAPAENVKVALYEGKLEDDRGTALEGKTPADTKTTDKDGKVSFELKGDTYTIVLSDYDDTLKLNYPEKELVNTVTKDAPNAQLTFKEPARIGSNASVPLAFKLGENSVPLTNDALSYATYGIAYAFTPDKTSNYTVAATENAVVLDENMMPIVSGGESAVIAIESGKTKLFYCTATGTPKTYTVTITEGGEIGGGGDEPTLPWTEGEGTVDDPYVVESLEGTYSDLAASGSPFYISYTPAADEVWTFTQIGEDLWLEVYDDKEDIVSGSGYLIQIGDDVTTGDVSMKSGTTYYIAIGTWSGDEGSVSFKAEKKSGGSSTPADGTKEHPYVVDSIDRFYNYNVPNSSSLVYFSYTPKETEYYTITSSNENVWVTIYEENSYGSPVFAGGYEDMPSDFTLEEGNTYCIEVDAYTYQEEDPTADPDITFIIEKKEEATELYEVTITVKLVNGNNAGAGVIVRLIDENNHQYDAVTDENGVAHFELPDGTYQIQAPRAVFSDGEFKDSAIPEDEELNPETYTVEVDGDDASREVQLTKKATTPEVESPEIE